MSILSARLQRRLHSRAPVAVPEDRGGKRARFLVGAAATATSVYLGTGRARAAQFVYRLGHPNTVEFPGHVALVEMAAAIKRETNDRLEIQIFPNSALGSQGAMIGQVRLGSIQFLNLGNASYSGLVPVAAIDSVGFAFSSDEQALDTLASPLGAYIRKEFAAKGLYAFERPLLFGFRQMTSSVKPIKTVVDFSGLKMRVQNAAIMVDLFKTLDASPIPLDAGELYTSLQAHIVDAQETPLSAIESFKLFEVQKFLSITNHIWTGAWLLANAEAWSALPPDIQDVVQRNAAKYARIEWKYMLTQNASVADKLQRQGMAQNVADTSSMRARLSPYYARWKSQFGSTAWGLLEDKIGKRG